MTQMNQNRGRMNRDYDTRAMVVKAGEGDLSDVNGRRPEDLLDDFRTLVLSLRAEDENAPVYFVSLRPSPAREERWYGAQRANALIADYVSRERGMYFIDVTPVMLDQRGNIRDDLYRWDGLTLNDKGYAALAEAIKPVLIEAGYGGLRSSR